MGRGNYVGALLALSLIANAFSLPTSDLRIKRQSSDSSDLANNEITVKDTNVIDDDDDDDDDDDFPTYPQNDPTGGGSNLFSLLNLVTALLPGSSSSSGRPIQKFLKEIVNRNKPNIIIRRQAIINDIKTGKNDIVNFKLPPNKYNLEIENSENESNESEQDTNEESLENDEERNQSDENSIELDDDDYDEPPGGGDGEGGGLLGLLAGLSGGEDGQSDLGSLLATVSGIIANLSGDGIDLNALIASGIGLFVGLLSEGEENPGEILASYLLTSLDTITGGGAQNNGAFFGKFLSKLIKGTSAGGDPDAESEENGNVETKDSAGFFLSLIMGLLGDMSKGSSGSHPMK